MEEDSKEELKRGRELLGKLAREGEDKKEKVGETKEEKISDSEEEVSDEPKDHRKKIEEIARSIMNRD